MRKSVTFSVIVTGFTAMASQIIYMRQFLVAFYGNELSISFILAGWLVSGAIGSAILGRFADRIRSKIRALSLCQILLAVFLIAGIVAANFIKTFLGVNPGEIIPLFPIIVMSFVILAPVCILLGFIFSLSCRICASEYSEGSLGIGRVYILEAIGSIIGGAITSFVLIKLFDPLHIIAIFALLNLLAAFMIALFSYNDSRRAGLNPPYGYGLLSVTAGLTIIIALAWILGGLGKSGQALADLGIDYHDASGNIKSANVLFQEVSDKMGPMEDGLNKTQLMMDIFGKSGKEMGDLLGAAANGGR